MACPVPTPCFLSSLSLLSLSTVHYHTRTEETSWKKATKKATVHLNLYRNKTATRTKKKVLESLTMKKYFSAHPQKGKYASSQIILSVMLLFIFSIPFLLFLREDQAMTACTFCSVIINQETVWGEWCQPPAESKGSRAVLFIIRKLKKNIYQDHTVGAKVTMYILQGSI